LDPILTNGDGLALQQGAWQATQEGRAVGPDDLALAGRPADHKRTRLDDVMQRVVHVLEHQVLLLRLAMRNHFAMQTAGGANEKPISGLPGTRENSSHPTGFPGIFISSSSYLPST